MEDSRQAYVKSKFSWGLIHALSWLVLLLDFLDSKPPPHSFLPINERLLVVIQFSHIPD